MNEWATKIYGYPAERFYELMRAAIQQPVTNSLPPDNQTFERRQEMYKIMRGTQEKQDAHAADIRSYFISTNNWDDAPLLIIQSIPTSGPPRLNNFYDEVEQAFINARPVRSMGFSLDSLGAESDTAEGAFIKTGTRDAALRLDPDGTLTLAIKASEDFLGWSINKNRSVDDIFKINSIVLLEITFEFVRFIDETLTKFGLQSWRYCLYTQNLRKHKVALYSGGPGSAGVYRPHLAAKDTLTKYIGSSKDTQRTFLISLLKYMPSLRCPLKQYHIRVRIVSRNRIF